MDRSPNITSSEPGRLLWYPHTEIAVSESSSFDEMFSSFGALLSRSGAVASAVDERLASIGIKLNPIVEEVHKADLMAAFVKLCEGRRDRLIRTPRDLQSLISLATWGMESGFFYIRKGFPCALVAVDSGTENELVSSPTLDPASGLYIIGSSRRQIGFDADAPLLRATDFTADLLLHAVVGFYPSASCEARFAFPNRFRWLFGGGDPVQADVELLSRLKLLGVGHDRLFHTGRLRLSVLNIFRSAFQRFGLPVPPLPDKPLHEFSKTIDGFHRSFVDKFKNLPAPPTLPPVQWTGRLLLPKRAVSRPHLDLGGGRREVETKSATEKSRVAEPVSIGSIISQNDKLKKSTRVMPFVLRVKAIELGHHVPISDITRDGKWSHVDEESLSEDTCARFVPLLVKEGLLARQHAPKGRSLLIGPTEKLKSLPA